MKRMTPKEAKERGFNLEITNIVYLKKDRKVVKVCEEKVKLPNEKMSRVAFELIYKMFADSLINRVQKNERRLK